MFKNLFSRKEKEPVYSDVEEALIKAYNAEDRLKTIIYEYREIEKKMSALMEEAEKSGNSSSARRYSNDAHQAKIDREEMYEALMVVKKCIIKFKTDPRGDEKTILEDKYLKTMQLPCYNEDSKKIIN